MGALVNAGDIFGDFFDFSNVNEPDISAPAGAPVTAPAAPLSGVGDAGGFTPSFGSNISDIAGITNPDAETVTGFTSGNDQIKDFGGQLSTWVRQNKEVAAALVQGIMGALGGAGKAALDRQTLERKAQIEQDALNAAVARKSAGSFRGNLGMGPSGNQVLMRPSGGPVYDPSTGQIIRPGLINQAARA